MSLLKSKLPKASCMETPLARERLNAILACLRGTEHATLSQIAEAVGLGRHVTKPYVLELMGLGIVARDGSLKGPGHIALYRFVADIEHAPEMHPPRQRTVAAEDWPRGEHVGCVGVPVFFPVRA